MSRTDERLEEFINHLRKDYDKLQTVFPNERSGRIKAMLCQLDYVNEFKLVPLFCRVESKLPKGYKKTDGEKVVITSGYSNKRKDRHIEYLVECGDDLYISGIIWCRCRSKKKSDHERWLVVENWRTMTAMQIIGGIERDGKLIQNQIRDVIFQLYKDNDLPIGMVEPILRDL